MEKRDYHKITVADMSPHIHHFQPNENKVEKILEWIKNWIQMSLECGKIHPYYLLPSKADLAYHIGVSQGTMQNVFRLLEDAGIVESKQRIGTYIINSKKKIKIKKFTSKREIAVEVIKKYFSENNLKVGDKIMPMRKLAKITGISNTTLRMAMSCLLSEGFLEKQENDFVIKKIDFQVKNIQIKTLVEKVAESLKIYIFDNYTTGDRLPSNIELTKIFNVSSKTIHDAIKLLSKQGVLYTRRGQYGTIVLGEKMDSGTLYFYEKIEQKIRQYLVDNCQVGDKLPSIREFAKIYKTSEKTIKKALDNLSQEGYLGFARGRYGGTFVMDMPQPSGESYKWLAISTDYIAN